MLIDAHTHLDMKHFESDRDRVVQRALSAGVGRIITVGIDLMSSLNAIKLTTTYPCVFAAIGIHPHNTVRAGKNDLDEISLMAQQKKIIAIGEIGLDFYRNRSPIEKQIKLFKQQLDMAALLDLPVVIHDREAHAKTVKILSLFKRNRRTGMIHCFSGDYSLAETFINMGYYISIPGIVTYKNAIQIQDVIKRIPLNRVLIETDAPFLAPVPYRGRRNEPCYLTHTAQKIANLRSISLEEVAHHTSENACRLFNLPFSE